MQLVALVGISDLKLAMWLTSNPQLPHNGWYMGVCSALPLAIAWPLVEGITKVKPDADNARPE